MANIDRWLKHMAEVGGTSLHCIAGDVPRLRVAGALLPLDSGTETARTEIDGMLRYVASEEMTERREGGSDVDFVFELPDVGRFRAHAFEHRLGPALVFRAIPAVCTLAELGLPKVMSNVARATRGLVLVAGPPSSGKSCTVAAMINELNAVRSVRISTIEHAIGAIHVDRACTITQREVGAHVSSMAAAVRAASRDSEVIVIDELADEDAIQQALLAAEAGRLVIATVSANSVAGAFARLTLACSEQQREQTRRRLAASYLLVTSQILLSAAARRGLVVAAEVLLKSRVGATAIRDADDATLEAVMERGEGSMTLAQSLRELATRGLIRSEDARDRAREAPARAESLPPRR